MKKNLFGFMLCMALMSGINSLFAQCGTQNGGKMIPCDDTWIAVKDGVQYLCTCDCYQRYKPYPAGFNAPCSRIDKTNTNNNAADTKTQEEQEQAAREEELKRQEELRRQEELKRQQELKNQAAHDKMMTDYKPLNSTGNVAFKGLDNGNQFQKINFSCKMTEFKGQVVVVKSDGKKTVLTEGSIVDLAPGDSIATGPFSRVKLHYAFEKGGKDVILGQNSGLTIITEEDGQHTPRQVAGNLYAISDSLSEMSIIVQEEIQYKIDQVIGFGAKSINILKKCPKVRMVTACACVRGTEFTSTIDSLGCTTIHVFEGMVDLYGDSDDRVVTLTAGYYGVVNAEGKIVKYEKFEMEKFERWWEE